MEEVVGIYEFDGKNWVKVSHHKIEIQCLEG